MTRLLIGGPLLLLIACNSNINSNEYALPPDKSHFSWIGDGKEQPEKDYEYYLEDPSPVFRKEFIAEAGLRSAKLLITAAGYYQASINGERLDEVMLDPAWTDFSKRVYYSEYDITDLIDRDTNCIGVTLGNGFYNPLPLKMWGSRNLREDLNTGRPVFIAGIFLEYEKGKKDEIYTDNTWRYSYGPILRNNVYLGEIYDARREINGWNQPGFDDSSWKNAKISSGPGGKLEKAFFPPVRITERMKPVNIYSPSKGVYIADMGVNFTGVYRIKLKGPEGDTITFRFGERIYEDGSLNPMTAVCGQIKRKGVGGPGAPDIAWQADTFIIGSVAETWYKPEFTFHTYRYMEIKGLEYMPEIADIEGLVLHSDVVNNNSFSCSSNLINSIQQASERTFRSNLVSVQSDCAAREKFAYGGDLNASSESFIYNFDMHSFYIKTIYDWLDALNDSVFVDTAPYVGIKYCGLSWESAFLITQYYLYLYYNDIDLVQEMYKFNNEWMDKVARIHPDGWVS
ncbi:MAG: family 78 glycoside hydrolase catalytic domain, partial [Bacteroidales bacterium]|nr:family 78 glycoside hydrolase catalytic domain [Bacteroidales bacterium]